MKKALLHTATVKQHLVVFVLIVSIWLFILAFALLTLLQPAWLKQLSEPGRLVESNSYVESANVQMYQGHFEKAIELYATAVKIDSTNVDALGNMGIAYMYLGNYALAEELFVKTITRNPDDFLKGVFYQNMGDLYDRMKKPATALDYYSTAIEKGLANPYVYRKAGYLSYQLGNDSLAILYIQTSINNIKSLEYYYDEALIEAYRFSVMHNYTDCMQSFSAKLENILKHEDMSRFCSEILDVSIQLSKDLGFAYYYLTEISLKNGDVTRAHEYAALSRRYYPQIVADVNKLFN